MLFYFTITLLDTITIGTRVFIEEKENTIYELCNYALLDVILLCNRIIAWRIIGITLNVIICICIESNNHIIDNL